MIRGREWLKETASITMIYLFNMIEILTGFLAVQLIPYTKLLPWILILFPIFLTVRGAISGAFIGNLTTHLHLGTIIPSFRKNSPDYYTLIQTIFLFSISNALIVSTVLGIYIWNLMYSFSAFILVLIVFTISVSFSIVATSVIGFTSFKKGLDPDVIVYPVISTMNDVAILIFFLGILALLEPWVPIRTIILGILPVIIILSISIIILKKIKNESLFKEVFRESYGTIFYSLLLSTVSGIILSSITSELAQYPSILTVLPAIMTTMGDVGSITASTFTTKLRISGSIESPVSFSMSHLVSIFPKLGIPFILFSIILSFFSCTLNAINYDVFFLTLFVIASSGILDTILIGLLAIIVSISSFIYGINPDNVAIPILTVTADFISIISITLILKYVL